MKIRDALPTDKKTVLDFCKDTFSWGDYIVDVWDSWILQGKLFVADEKRTQLSQDLIIYTLSISAKFR